MATLRYEGPLGEAGHYELTKDKTVIGRRTRSRGNADIVLDGEDVSRTHAVIFREDGQWFLQDDASRNHTLLNGRDITGHGRQRLRDDAAINIRQHRFVFEDPESGNASSIQIFDDMDTGDMFPSSSISLERLPYAPQPDANKQDDASKRLSALIQISRTLQKTLMLDDVLASTLDALFLLLSVADRGFIGKVSSEGVILPRWWRFRDRREAPKINVSQTIVKRVIADKEALLFDKDFTAFPETESVYILPLGSVICAPLLDADGEATGVLQIDASRPGGFTTDDLELVAAVAVQVSFALNMSQLHETAVRQQILLRDVENARKVQDNFLPERPPSVPGYEFASYYEPAKSIGGDYFDFVTLRDGRQAVVLADVGGKGVPAALYMARLATETRACLQRYDEATQVIAELNRSLTSCFVTFSMAILNPASHEVTVVNAGHRPPIVRKQDGSLVDAGAEIVGFPFSVLDDTEFQSARFVLEPGEVVVMSSDGFEDALRIAPEERFGIERIRQLILDSDGTAKQLVQSIVQCVSEFTGDTPQFDDMCLVVFRRKAD